MLGTRGRVLKVCCLLAALAIGATAVARAQTLVPPIGQSSTPDASSEIVIPDKLAPEDVDRILAALTDAQVRQLLTVRLRESAQAQAAQAKRGGGGGLAVAMVQFRNRIIGFTGTLRTRWTQLRQGLAITPGELANSFDKVTGGQGLPGFLAQTAGLLAVLAAGAAAHFGLWRLTGGSTAAPPAETLSARLGAAGFRALRRLLALAGFALVAILATALAFGGGASPEKTFVVTYLTAALIVLASNLVLRFVLAPGDPGRRPVPLTDATAGFLYGWIMLLATVGVFAWLTAGLFILTGMALGAHLVVVMATGGLVALLLIAMIVQARAPIAALIIGDRASGAPPGRLREQLARSWHVLAIAYLLAVWFLWSMSMLARDATAVWSAVGSVGVVALLVLIDRVLRGLLFKAPRADVPAESGGYAEVVLRAARGALAVAGALALLELWGVGLFAGGEAGDDGAILQALFDVGITIVLAVVVWQLTKIAIDRSLKAEAPAETAAADGEGMGTSPSTRAQTLLPLIQKFILVVLFVMTAMIILSSLGVDIGPLLAGAGVVGLAIGFGAQTLVRDVVSGVFFLIDDAFRLGEYVDLGSVKGEVEAINLRSLRLRHHRGAVNTIPFGELHAIVNYSRDWAIYKMEFRVPFDTDIERVRKIVKKIGLELLEDEEFGPMFIEPLKSQGVLRTDESALIIRTKFTSKPGEQFYIRREAYKRIRDKFIEAGIEFAPRTIAVGGVASGQAAAAAAAAGATSGAAAGPGSSV